MPSLPVVEIGVLGPLEVKAFGQQVDLGGREAVVLSALALRAGQVVSTGTLMERLWGEVPPPTASKALQNVIVRLRKRLQPDPSCPSVLLTRGSGYVLDVPRWRVDAHRFMDDLQAARAHGQAGDAKGGSNPASWPRTPRSIFPDGTTRSLAA